AGDVPHAELFGFFKEYVDRVRMNGAVNHRAGDAVAEIFAQINLRDVSRMGRIRKRFLGGKGVLVKPVEQLLAERSDDLRLRIMHVRIDEARKNNSVFVAGEIPSWGERWQNRIGRP